MQILYEYSHYLSTYYSSYTKETYLEQVKLFLNFLKEYKGRINTLILYNIEQKDIYNYLAFISDYEKGTIRLKINAIKNFYNFLDKKLATFLFQDIKYYSNKIRLPKYLTLQQSKALIQFYTGEKRDIIFLFLNLGIRLAEMVNLDFKNINFEENYLQIIQKGSIQRRVYFSDQTKQVLKKYNGFSYNRRQIQYFISYAMKKLGINGSTHTLRHTFATCIYNETQDILLVKELLGHKSVLSTQIYTHVTNKELKNAIYSNPLSNFGVGGGEDK